MSFFASNLWREWMGELVGVDVLKEALAFVAIGYWLSLGLWALAGTPIPYMPKAVGLGLLLAAALAWLAEVLGEIINNGRMD